MQSATMEPQVSLSELRRIFDTQQANQWRVARTNARERIATLRRLEQAVLRYREDIRAALYADFRKPPLEVDMVEMHVVLSEIRHTIKNLRRWMAPQSVPTTLALLGTRSFIQYEPKGVVLIISPWNYPINLTLAPLVSAIAAGNCAILKPSELTPHTSAVLARLIREIFPEDEVAVVQGDANTAQALLNLPFNHIFYTGSPAIGKLVMAAAAKHLASVTLELGGKSPVIIDETADIDMAARRVAWVKYTNNGQTCIAPDYVLVHESQKADFIAATKKYIQQFFSEDASQSVDYARIVNGRHFERLHAYVEEAVASGAQVPIGGQSDATIRYIAPTILTDVPEGAKVMEEEIFGPLLPVLTFRALPEAVAHVNANERPLALYIFSRRRRYIRQIVQETRSGAVAINHNGIHFFNNNLPFGGVNNSGIGKAHGWFGFEAFSNAKGVLRQVLPSALELLLPPYNAFKQRMIDLVLKWL